MSEIAFTIKKIVCSNVTYPIPPDEEIELHIRLKFHSWTRKSENMVYQGVIYVNNNPVLSIIFMQNKLFVLS